MCVYVLLTFRSACVVAAAVYTLEADLLNPVAGKIDRRTQRATPTTTSTATTTSPCRLHRMCELPVHTEGVGGMYRMRYCVHVTLERPQRAALPPH